LRLRRRLCAIVVCACAPALLLAACGGGGSSGNGGSSTAPTATLPATLPSPMVLGNGVVQAGGGTTYVIKSGDTLAAIASRFGVSIDDLRTANPGVDAQNLHAGDSIRLPAGTSDNPTPAAPPTEAPPTEAPPAPAATDTPLPPAPPTEAPAAPTATPAPATGAQTYTVQAGDIPLTIAQKFGITVDALLAANPGLDPRNMHVGDVINIPAPPPGG
jgi:LysM repeat protein